MLARFRPLLAAEGLTEQQWRVIRGLLETGPLEPREIVVRCGIWGPSLAGVLARMEDLGLVRRERLAHDQRRLHVSLTASSRAAAARLAPAIEAGYAALAARLGADRPAALYEALDELIERVGPAAASNEAPPTDPAA